jgi:hypothetical protein
MGPVKGVPKGTIMKDANILMPKKELLNFPSNSQASDYYRVLMILNEGGWYVDLDTICLQPLEFSEDYVFASEDVSGSWPRNRKPGEMMYPCSIEPQPYISNHIFKAPKDSDFLKYISDRIRGMDTKHPMEWTSMGPNLFIEGVAEFDFEKFVKAPIVFDLLNPHEYGSFISSGFLWDVDKRSYSIHLRSSFWTSKSGWGLNPNGKYPDDSWFEFLKREHNVC